MRTCKVCGRELPEEMFTRTPIGLLHTCKECNAKRIAESKAAKKKAVDLNKEIQNARHLKLNDFTPRELMAELKRRGYEFTMKFIEVHVIDSKDI